jgi:ribosome biogenesis GTPase / thiamine phosphate phosphatase
VLDPTPLVPIGWNDRWEEKAEAATAALEASGVAEPVVGRVARVDRRIVSVITAAGTVRVGTGPDPVATGDWVLFADGDTMPEVASVLPRRSAFVRGDPMDGTARNAQVVAANVDTVFVTQSFENGPNLRRLERELVLAFESGAEPVVVLTKADLAVAPVDVTAVERTASGAPVIVTSTVSGVGIDALRRFTTTGRTVALIGASGVGKSTLVNALVGADVQATGEVRARDQRGRHTTTARELVLLPDGGVLVDTPGLRAVTLWVADEGFRRAFADIEALAPDCRFHDCAHDREPGCAVQAAVARGELDAARVLHYRELDAELDDVARREREREEKNARGRRPTAN